MDNLLLLAQGGMTAYWGSQAEATQYFEGLKFQVCILPMIMIISLKLNSFLKVSILLTQWWIYCVVRVHLLEEIHTRWRTKWWTNGKTDITQLLGKFLERLVQINHWQNTWNTTIIQICSKMKWGKLVPIVVLHFWSKFGFVITELWFSNGELGFLSFWRSSCVALLVFWWVLRHRELSLVFTKYAIYAFGHTVFYHVF